MTANRIDRYVDTAVAHLPEALRPQVAQAVRAQITTDIQARVDSGLTRPAAEHTVLRDLGEPTDHRLRATTLISPRLHRGWRLATSWACATVLPIVFIVLVAVYAVHQDNLWITIFRPIGITLTVAMYLLVAVTGVCALVDRYGAASSEDWPQPSRST